MGWHPVELEQHVELTWDGNYANVGFYYMKIWHKYTSWHWEIGDGEYTALATDTAPSEAEARTAAMDTLLRHLEMCMDATKKALEEMR